VPVFESKLTAVAVSVFVPFFFIVNGMKLDVKARFASPGGVARSCCSSSCS
jgi:Kef-type K+ transport system membrane component KefB